ncbi:Alpha/beta hydrolase fold-1 [Penicillium malachiteum]|nr:Alpha/beta hydrolase fold-1 [Penicillium malachiteum]
MAPITPFTIDIPDKHIDQLNQKLQHVSFPDELDDAGWEMGVPLETMKRLVTTWREKFDWRAQEKKLNEQLNQFTVPIAVDGFGDLDIHVVHHRSGNPRAVPLLFIHGWPGSFLEATKLIPLLTQNDEGVSFDVIAPSLPNFGFSQGIKKRGFGLAQYAETMHKVMLALGYEKYAIQGGDWGSIIARLLAFYYGEHVQAVHLNLVPVLPPYPWRNPLLFLSSLISIPFSAKHRGYIARTLGYNSIGNAYYKQQASRPQTLGYGLHDSPVALLAWIYDKLHSWSDNYAWTDVEILTWVSIYYFSRAGPTASTRIYYEATGKKPDDVEMWISLDQAYGARAPDNVRFAVAQFKEEIMMWPMAWYRVIGSVVKEKEFDCGGHFAAWEQPELLAGDLKEFLGKGGAAYAVIEGKEGYRV